MKNVLGLQPNQASRLPLPWDRHTPQDLGTRPPGTRPPLPLWRPVENDSRREDSRAPFSPLRTQRQLCTNIMKLVRFPLPFPELLLALMSPGDLGFAEASLLVSQVYTHLPVTLESAAQGIRDPEHCRTS